MIQWVLKTGLVSTRREAEYVLIGIIGIAILVSVYTLFFGSGSSNVPERYQYNAEEYDPAQDPEEPSPSSR